MLSGIFAWALPFFLISLMSAVAEAQGGGGAARELWCVAKNNAEDAALQSALDWTCGPGGADCGPIQEGGPCYDASDLQRTASFAFNDYYLKHGLSDESCNFGNTAALTSLNPSHNNCKFPSSLSSGNGNFSGAATDGSDTSDLSSNTSIAYHSGWGSIAIHLLFAVLLIL
ncbi:plasmodesmata callose-binding protein 5 [Sesamum alatum]|uniref:Plasmodesmata callose-binding protein 5 n=1 Tax=Sesamum alatum TaxID=300844 RepID=A0AAE1YY39_9LAMI|nr:plasmodesmata callose-binding protein 5 [Sesamum alatum]